MHNERHDERLSDEELGLFIQYMHRFANHYVDAFLNQEVGYPEYPVYVTFSRAPEPGIDVSSVHRRPFTDRRRTTSTTDINDGG